MEREAGYVLRDPGAGSQGVTLGKSLSVPNSGTQCLSPRDLLPSGAVGGKPQNHTEVYHACTMGQNSKTHPLPQAREGRLGAHTSFHLRIAVFGYIHCPRLGALCSHYAHCQLSMPWRHKRNGVRGRGQGGHERTPPIATVQGRASAPGKVVSTLSVEAPKPWLAGKLSLVSRGDFLETVIKGTGFARNLSYNNSGARIIEESDLPKATQLSNWDTQSHRRCLRRVSP